MIPRGEEGETLHKRGEKKEENIMTMMCINSRIMVETEVGFLCARWFLVEKQQLSF